jgi:hypothetical protein
LFLRREREEEQLGGKPLKQGRAQFNTERQLACDSESAVI